MGREGDTREEGGPDSGISRGAVRRTVFSELLLGHHIHHPHLVHAAGTALRTATKLWSAVGWIIRASLKPSAKVYLHAIEATRQRRHVLPQLRVGHGPYPLAVPKLRAGVCGVGAGCVLASVGCGRRSCRDGQARRWERVGAVPQRMVGILAHEMCSGRMNMLMIPRKMVFSSERRYLGLQAFRDILGFSAALAG